jgi:hypothetical protein
MSIILFPVFKKNRAYTPQAIARYNGVGLTLPNMNSLPVGLKKPEEFAPYAAKQVAKLFDRIHKAKLYNCKLPIVITASFLFPQLGRCTLKKIDLRAVWGSYAKAVIRLIAAQPADKLLFSLDHFDDVGDAQLLSMLALQPMLMQHKFLLNRPLHSTQYVMRKSGKRKSKGTQDTAILYCDYTDYCNIQQNKPDARRLQHAAKAGSFFIFD